MSEYAKRMARHQSERLKRAAVAAYEARFKTADFEKAMKELEMSALSYAGWLKESKAP